jgi:hypothetical protein
LGTTAVYGGLGGAPAGVLFLVAVIAGTLVAAKAPVGDPIDIGFSAVFSLSRPAGIGAWGSGVALALGIGTVGAIGWLTLEGLRVGFL